MITNLIFLLLIIRAFMHIYYVKFCNIHSRKQWEMKQLPKIFENLHKIQVKNHPTHTNTSRFLSTNNSALDAWIPPYFIGVISYKIAKNLLDGPKLALIPKKRCQNITLSGNPRVDLADAGDLLWFLVIFDFFVLQYFPDWAFSSPFWNFFMFLDFDNNVAAK